MLNRSQIQDICHQSRSYTSIQTDPALVKLIGEYVEIYDHIHEINNGYVKLKNKEVTRKQKPTGFLSFLKESEYIPLESYKEVEFGSASIEKGHVYFMIKYTPDQNEMLLKFNRGAEVYILSQVVTIKKAEGLGLYSKNVILKLIAISSVP